MKSLSSTATSFEPPHLTAEQWAEANRMSAEYDAEQRERRRRERLDSSRIPTAYRKAELSECDVRVSEWVCAHRRGSTRDLLLTGRMGRGKTWSACAALMALLPDERCLFSTVDDLLRELKATYDGDRTEEEVIGRYRGVPVLCLDDLGKAKTTSWMLPQLHSVIEHRITNGRPTIYTTQYDSRALIERLTADDGDAETSMATVSRLQAAFKVRLTGPDRRGDGA